MLETIRRAPRRLDKSNPTTIGPNPTLTQLSVPHKRKQFVGESRQEYVKSAASYAKRVLAKMLKMPEYQHTHKSFAIRDAMLVTEATFTDLGTFGVERIEKGSNQRSPSVEYLNSGDPYELTVLHVNGRFRAGCWGNIVERGNYA